MHRFFITKDDIQDNHIILSGQNAQHASVLRLKIGEFIVLCDGICNDYYCSISSMQNMKYIANINFIKKNTNEPKANITLFQSLPKMDKLEHILQKSVELGIFCIVPVISQNCIAKMQDNNDKKLLRLQNIAESAAKQSHRGIIPKVLPLHTFKEALELSQKSARAIAFYESATSPLKPLLHQFRYKNISSLAYFIGPEGGYTLNEAEEFKKNNILTVSLSKSILRTETAAIAAIANIAYELN